MTNRTRSYLTATALILFAIVVYCWAQPDIGVGIIPPEQLSGLVVLQLQEMNIQLKRLADAMQRTAIADKFIAMRYAAIYQITYPEGEPIAAEEPTP